MINRRNWRDVQAHLEYREAVHQDVRGTLQTRESLLNLMLIWADDELLTRAPDLRPAYPQYLARQRRDGEHLSYNTQERAVSVAKTFFKWATAAHPRRYRQVTRLWLDALRPVKSTSGVTERQAYALEDVRAMLAVDGDSLIVQRAKAAAALLFLSGMRIGAFLTLPIRAVDMERRRILQWTDLGVQTKYRKSATTFLLDIPDLLTVVRAWDDRVRTALDPEDLWYCNVEGAYHRHVVPSQREGTSASTVYRYLRELCDRAGVAYMSPHKLRHGHVMHGLEHARNPADWKAISQNVMHSNLSTTDAIYGILKDDEVANRIARLGGSEGGGGEAMGKEEILAQIQALAAQL
jgi:site-specific recombinase XerD